jgi:hypothetical protein
MKTTLKPGFKHRFVIACDKFNARVLDKAKAAGAV